MRDRQVYFITSRCRDQFPAIALDEAKEVFWAQFDKYTDQFGFVPWITSLLDNHDHTLGFLREGSYLPTMMRSIHGSIAKLTNDILERHGALRLVPFWVDSGKQNYFDRCLRDATQCRRAYRYIQRQSVRHRICQDWREYPHTRVRVELDRGVARALELGAFLTGVPYRRYSERRSAHADWRQTGHAD